MMRAISRADLVSKPWEASFMLSVMSCWRRDPGSCLSAGAFDAGDSSCVNVVVAIESVPNFELYSCCEQGRSYESEEVLREARSENDEERGRNQSALRMAL